MRKEGRKEAALNGFERADKVVDGWSSLLLEKLASSGVLNFCVRERDEELSVVFGASRQFNSTDINDLPRRLSLSLASKDLKEKACRGSQLTQFT